MDTSFGFGHFLSNLDGVGRLVLALLGILSVASWTVAARKVAQAWSLSRRERRFFALWRMEVRTGVVAPLDDPWSRVACRGLSAVERLGGAAPDATLSLTQPEQVVATSLGRAVQEEIEEMEKGLVLVATTSSAAPFVGLFGTVWSIYHALVAIGQSGEGGLDKVAGPVGEALVMTGIGLAVAIPALLAYNALGAWQRGIGFRLEGFAQEVFTSLATGPLRKSSEPGSASADTAARRPVVPSGRA